MNDKEFSLIDEPWILVLGQEGTSRTVSLAEVFRDAHRIKALSGEIVTQDVAILRLLLGIVHAVFGRGGLDGTKGLPQSADDARKRWKTLWDLAYFPLERIEAYLREWEDYFYLFHPLYPFLQVAPPPDAAVRINDRMVPVRPLFKSIRNVIGDLAESENKPKLFSHRTKTSTLEYAEAARWLVHINSFDTSPAGAPPRDGFRANGFSIPWPNTLGLVWAEGANLFETLMLNLVLIQKGMDPWKSFVPAWEENEPFQTKMLTKIVQPFPTDPCALFTFPFRRLQYVRNEQGRVSRCIVWGGHLVNAQEGNPFTETMTMWKKDREGQPQPKVHDASRQMWRDFSSLVAGGDANPPGVVSWLSGLRQNQALSLPLVRLNVACLVLSSKKSSVDDVYADSLRFSLAILTDLGEGWVIRISQEISLTEKLVQQAGFLAGDLVRAAGGSGEKDPKNAGKKAREQAYFLLDVPFRRWLEQLIVEDSMDEQCRAWRDTQGILMRQFGSDLVQNAGLQALTGRWTKAKPGAETETLYAAPKLYNAYLYRIQKLMKG